MALTLYSVNHDGSVHEYHRFHAPHFVPFSRFVWEQSLINAELRQFGELFPYRSPFLFELFRRAHDNGLLDDEYWHVLAFTFDFGWCHSSNLDALIEDFFDLRNATMLGDFADIANVLRACQKEHPEIAGVTFWAAETGRWNLRDGVDVQRALDVNPIDYGAAARFLCDTDVFGTVSPW